jgi:hypothetical protein
MDTPAVPGPVRNCVGMPTLNTNFYDIARKRELFRNFPGMKKGES